MRLPVPYPLGAGPGTQEFNRSFALANFDTRNLVRKNSNIKMIMTEEVLDDWEAQTLNIPFEKLVRHKKTLKNLEELERQRNSVKIKPILVQAQPMKKSKSMQPSKRNKEAKTVA